MEIFEACAYVFQEGAVIARRYLESQRMDTSGLKRAEVEEQ
jgi:ATP-dependent Lon protease